MAGKTLPGLIIKIGANTKDAIDGLNKVNRAVGASATGAQRLQASWRKVGPALGAAAAGVGALAVAIGVDAVRASVAEQNELVKLNQSLKNMGFASASDEVQRFIDDMQFAVNVSDGDLRPAFARLLRSTESITEAQKALRIALDISAATGKDLDTVANGLGKAYDGNAASLGRLGLGLDKTTLKGGNMVRITKELQKSFGGQAAAQANTLGGSIKGVQIAFDELSESFGKGIVGSSASDVKQLQDIEAQLRSMQPAAENLGGDVRDVTFGALTLYDRVTAFGEAIESQNWSSAFDMLAAGAKGADDEFAAIVRNFRTLDQIIPGVAINTGGLNYQTEGLGSSMATVADETDAATEAMKKQRSAADLLKASLDKLNGGARGIAGARLTLRQMRAQGPQDANGNKKIDRDERLDFALGYAAQVETLASELAANGQTKAARRALNQGRRFIGGFVGTDRAQEFLATPAWLDRGNAGQRAGGQRYQQGAGTTNNYYFNGDLLVKDAAEAVEQAKRNARLKALGNGRVAEAARLSGMAAS